MFTVSRLIHLVGIAVLIIFGLTSPAMSYVTISSATYEKHPGALLDDAPYITGFECLVHGEKYSRSV